MSKYTFRLLVILLAASNIFYFDSQAFAQPGPDVVYEKEKGKKIVKQFYPNGTLQSVERKNDGQLDGKQESYYPTGKPKLISNYKKGFLNGKSEEYYDNGKLKSVATHQQNQLVGSYKRYYNTGQLQTEQNYKIITHNGNPLSQLDGDYKEFDQTGKLVKIGKYLNGKFEGVWQTYKAGVLSDVQEYKEGKRHGKYERYFDTGQLKESGKYYELLVIDSISYQYIEDGPKKVMYPSGALERSEEYILGKKNGDFIKYFEDGAIKDRQHFTDNELNGLVESFDNNKKQTMQVSYTLVEVDGKLKGLKHGVEKSWQNGQLVHQTQYERGLEQGERLSYHPNGQLATITRMKNGKLEGKTEEYYPNGALKAERFYETVPYGSSEKVIQKGWARNYNEQGKLVSSYYRNNADEILFSNKFYKDKLAEVTVTKAFSISYFPTGEVMSISVVDQYNRPAFAKYYYLNGNLRKLTFQSTTAKQPNHADFTSDGRLISVYTDAHQNPDSMKVTNEIALLYKNAVGNSLGSNKLFTDVVKNGKYELKYGNGIPFLRANFTDDLLNGEFLVFDPIDGDTLVFKNFVGGQMLGPFLEKYGGDVVLSKGIKRTTQNESDFEEFSSTGIPLRKQFLQEDGSLEYSEYYPNGALKLKRNNERNIHYNYFENGDLMSYSGPISNDPIRRVYRDYFSETRTLRSEKFSTNNLNDSIHYQYFDNGKLQYLMQYMNGKRNGEYKEFTKEGKLKRKGMYVDDKQEGEWVMDMDTKPDTAYFKNGNRTVKMPDIPCACVDTTHSMSRVGFAPTVEGLVDYQVMKNYLPKYLVPANALNYKSIFYTGLQISAGNDNGFASMNLMVFKEMAFNVPADEQIQLLLNPCITPGYIPRMQISVNYAPNHPEQTYADFDVSKMAVRFLKGPIKSRHEAYEHFTALFKMKEFEMRRDQEMVIVADKSEPACFTPGVIRDYLKFDIVVGDLDLFRNNKVGMLYQQDSFDFSDSRAFFGVQSANVDYQFTVGENQPFTVNGNSKFSIFGGLYAAGVINIKCLTGNADEVSVKDSTGIERVIVIEDLRNEWLKRGFTRLKMNYEAEEKMLVIGYFAE